MATEFEKKHHDILADLIERVLRTSTGLIRVPELAQEIGFSRFHLARLFHEVTHETLEGFVRRVRLERAAFLLSTTSSGVSDIALDCGYKNAEAFSRAFKSAFGVSPTQFRGSDKSWKLKSGSDLHWNEHWGSSEPASLPGYVDMRLAYRDQVELAVWSWNGNYGRLADGWKELAGVLGSAIPQDRTFITIYYDNMWTHPTTTTMRADLGWVISGGDSIPIPMKSLVLPGGLYEMTQAYLKRTQRNDSWSYVGASAAPRKYSFDEYPTWPLPFESVLTRIVRGPIESMPLSRV